MPYDDLPRFELAFPGPLRDRLVAAVLSGAKTATTGLREEYSRLNEPLPVTGRREVMIDSAGRTVAVVEMTDVQVVPLGEIDLAYAIAEGEGHTSVAEWRADHERFWCGAEMRKAIGEVVIDDRTEVVAQRFRVAERLAPRAAEELLDIVDEEDRVIGQAPRGEAYARGLRHRCVFVFVRDSAGRIFVHRRTPGKLVFPSLHDMFVGGVVGAGESYDDAALREAEEELGVSGLSPAGVAVLVPLRGQGRSRRAHLVVTRVRGPLRPAGLAPGRGGRLARLPHRGGAGTPPARMGMGPGRSGGLPPPPRPGRGLRRSEPLLQVRTR